METAALGKVLAGIMCAAIGQVMFKWGASGAEDIRALLNLRVAAGGGFYLFGTLLWLMALSSEPLTKVYPFTIVTVVLVYVGGIALLGERPSSTNLTGIVLVSAGLVLIAR
jgi:drug/metabolite transporter (DMT)-like permease